MTEADQVPCTQANEGYKKWRLRVANLTPLQVEIVLARNEACPGCRGSGEWQTYRGVSCPKCLGTGLKITR